MYLVTGHVASVDIDINMPHEDGNKEVPCNIKIDAFMMHLAFFNMINLAYK